MACAVLLPPMTGWSTGCAALDRKCPSRSLARTSCANSSKAATHPAKGTPSPSGPLLPHAILLRRCSKRKGVRASPALPPVMTRAAPGAVDLENLGGAEAAGVNSRARGAPRGALAAAERRPRPRAAGIPAAARYGLTTRKVMSERCVAHRWELPPHRLAPIWALMKRGSGEWHDRTR
jgi:hypothetical protein